MPVALGAPARFVTKGVLGARISRASERASAKFRGGCRLEDDDDDASAWWAWSWWARGRSGWEGTVPVPAGRGKKRSINKRGPGGVEGEWAGIVN